MSSENNVTPEEKEEAEETSEESVEREEATETPKESVERKEAEETLKESVEREEVAETPDNDKKKKNRVVFDVLKLFGVLAALSAFFYGLFYAFQIDMTPKVMLPFILGFELLAIILLVIKRKKPSFPLKQIAGILIIIVGVGSVAVPFVAQGVTHKRQNEMINDIEAYFASMDKKEASGEDNPDKPSSSAATEKVTNEALEKEKESLQLLKGESIYGILEIPSLNLKYAIVQGGTRENIRTAVGRMTEGVNAGEEGNCILVGHRGGYYGTFFKNIDKLENGAEVFVTDLNNITYKYVVYEQKWISPYAWEELQAQPGETPGTIEKTLTLLSCEEKGELRIIVRARLVE